MEDAQICGSLKEIRARSGLRGLMPACMPASFTPGTAPIPPRNSISLAVMKRGLLGKSQHDVHVLHCLSGGAFAEIIDGAEHANHAPGYGEVYFGVVGFRDAENARRARRGKHAHKRGV